MLTYTSSGLRNFLMASAALAITAVAVAGCSGDGGTYYAKKHGIKDTTVASSTRSTATPTLASPGTATVVVPATVATTGTVLVPNTVTTANTVLVPSTSNTVGGTVIVPATQVPASQYVGSDVDFMARASQFNATEIAMSRIAYQRARSNEVRQFASDTIALHRRMADQLDAIALRRNVSLAFQPNPAGAQAVDRMSGLSGWDLDRVYLDQIIADHQAGASLYGMESNTAGDITLRSTAGGNAVELRNQLDQAARLRNDID